MSRLLPLKPDRNWRSVYAAEIETMWTVTKKNMVLKKAGCEKCNWPPQQACICMRFAFMRCLTYTMLRIFTNKERMETRR